MSKKSPIIVALDYPEIKPALHMAGKLDPKYCRIKVGKELFTTAGPSIIENLSKMGFDVFLDLKFHDIPTTTAKAVKAAANMGVWMVNLHASGGQHMMESCREILEQSTLKKKPLLIAVTILTSMNQDDLNKIGISNKIEQHVLFLAKLAQKSGMDGVVCSAQEAKVLKNNIEKNFSLVTPGIRPANYLTKDDQCRITTPAQAIIMGANYLVIGRPITKANNPMSVVKTILNDISNPK